MRNQKGITLVALVITVIILIILAGISLNVIFSENGLINKAKVGASDYDKSQATETMNLKITEQEMDSYVKVGRLPTLKELADSFCEDNDFEYVQETSEIASLTKISSENPTSIFTKLKAYSYEFEINSNLQLASINGVQVASATPSSNGSCDHLSSIISDFTPEVENLRSNKFTAKVPSSVSTNAIGYVYILGTEAKEFTKDTTYTFTGLTPATNYDVTIMAVDANGKIRYSSKRTVTTETIMYLYNNNIDEWEGRNCHSSYTAAGIFESDGIDMKSTVYPYSSYSCVTKEKIKVPSNYHTVYVLVKPASSTLLYFGNSDTEIPVSSPNSIELTYVEDREDGYKLYSYTYENMPSDAVYWFITNNQPTSINVRLIWFE